MTPYRYDVDVPPSDGPRAGMAQEVHGSRVIVRDVAVRGGIRGFLAAPDVTPDRPQLDDMDLLAGATAGAALACLALVAAFYAVLWLAGQPPVFWSRVGAVGMVLVGAGAMAGGLIGLERSGQRRGRRG